MPSTLVVNELGAWLRAGDTVVELAADEHAELVASSARDLQRVLRELASLAPADLRARDGVRLEITRGALQGTWLEVDDAGHPVRLGYELAGAPVELEFSGWTEFEGVYAPIEILGPGPGERRRVRAARRHSELSAELFSQP